MPFLLPPLPILSSSTSLLLKRSFTPTTQSIPYRRTLTSTPTVNMPEPLKASDVESKIDPTVANQWDDKTPKKQQIEEFYKTVDGMKIGLLTTIRDGIGPVARSMAVAKVRSSFLHPYRLYPYSTEQTKTRTRLTNLECTARRTRLPLPSQQTLHQIRRPHRRQNRPTHLPELLLPGLGLRLRRRRHDLKLRPPHQRPLLQRHVRLVRRPGRRRSYRHRG